jgi:DNA primase catalytic core
MLMSGQARGQSRSAEQASLRTGQDWVRWLEQARPAQPLSIQRHLSARRCGQVWAALAELARCEGFAVALGDCGAGDAVTSWHDRRIHVRRDADGQRAVAALVHELGHVLLHGEVAYLDRSGSLHCRGIRKVEADSVAYLVGGHLGIDAGAVTFADPPSWGGPGSRAERIPLVRAVSDRVLAAAVQITRHLDCALAEVAAPRRAGVAGTGTPVRRNEPAIAGGSGIAPRGETIPQLARANQAAARFFGGRLRASWVPGYLADRGFGADTLREWHAGYAPPGWDVLTRHLRALGYPAAVIQAAGLAHRSRRGTLIDTFRDRAMLPIHGHGGVIAGFIGRAPGHAGPGVPKYLNSPATRLYRKRETLFGLWQARDLLAAGARPVIAEGPFDAIAVTVAGRGRFAGLAPCGTALTAEHIAALGRVCDLPFTGVVVAFDPDPAGRNAAVAAYHLLTGHTDAAAAAVLPAGTDPAQIMGDRGAPDLAHVLAQHTRPLADLVIDAEIGRWSRWLGYAEGQINALRAAAPLIAVMPPAHVARQVARLAHRLGLDPATVTEAVTGALADVDVPAGGN